MRSTSYASFVLAAATAISLITACSGGGSKAVPPVGLSSAEQRGFGSGPRLAAPLASPGVDALLVGSSGPVHGRLTSPWLSHLSANVPKFIPVLYVSGATCACVLVYSQLGHDQAPIGMITGMSDARGLFVCKAGGLFVGNSLADTVPIYSEDNLKSPIKTLQDPGNHPSDIARDTDGTIYVVNQNTDAGGPGSISVYAHGSKTPTSYLNPHANTFVDSDTLDAHHNLFVGYGDPNGVNHIDEFKHGSTNPIQLHMTPGYTGGMEIDNTNDILVADPDFFNGHNQPAVDIFEKNATSPEFQFDQLGWPYYVALNQHEHHVWVSDAQLSQVREYTYPGGVLIDTITKGMENGNYPVGVAVDHPGPL
jgi:hypothetical protein